MLEDLDFFEERIGVDAGQTLTKVAYVERGTPQFHFYRTDLDKIDLLRRKIGFRDKLLSLTGGKALYYKEKLDIDQINILEEFKANSIGVRHLVPKEKRPSEYLVVTIGSGTSIVHEKGEEVRHVGGTALGGSMFDNFAGLICDVKDHQRALELAEKGNRYNIDLKVGDIYPREDDRIEPGFREMTAASFGKLDKEIDEICNPDFLNSLISMIGENIAIIASSIAKNKDINKIVYAGGFLENNNILKNVLDRTTKLNEIETIYPQEPMFIGAIGALRTDYKDLARKPTRFSGGVNGE
ncbi:MAG: Activator of 2-hydroxyglutaryl-CoA dehydratase, HSP70-class ATPase [Candidatus Methanohalarchaeum thermophilum]|uniref:Activator of 2-hydroxyglutaryl-CoA dehydratase, HSP70-class ATPase n=1 Tax=Methanohalarchaeum thermophilum TaxID=1903181 RepID=A0A1Q6DS87_METT1|nr:MAG: Activator of 2-hydroxyglutaryl-CoA dehydratase, HSP70-class ATPase [Candidatus Methanohalarchaeum thermophilum]